jgi:hypothetical protein
MSEQKSISQDDELKHMAELARNVSRDFNTLRAFIKEKRPSHHIETLAQKLNDASDMIFLIDSELTAKTDGRPQPISLDGDPEVVRCDSPGYATVVTIGDHEFARDELIQLRGWIDEALAWHQKMEGHKYG